MLSHAGFGVLLTQLVGRIIYYRGSNIPLVIGSVFLLIGTGLLLTYNENTIVLWLLSILALLGIGNGFTGVSSQILLYENIKDEDTGSASGLFQTSRYLGAILSGSFLGIAFNHLLDDSSLHFVAIVCFVVCLFIIGISIILLRKTRRNS